MLKAIHDPDPSRAVIPNDGSSSAARPRPCTCRTTTTTSARTPSHGAVGSRAPWAPATSGTTSSTGPRTTTSICRRASSSSSSSARCRCATADNHEAMVVEILAKGGQSYDLQDHKDIVAATNSYIERWGFKSAFPTSEALFLSVGRKVYESWRNYLENIRLGETVDVAAISGWESTAIENHSGIVDALRGFKADPAPDEPGPTAGQRRSQSRAPWATPPARPPSRIFGSSMTAARARPARSC
ncbi:hypothetical protein ACRAWD_15270 [Caulobacter segnis]